MFNQPTTDRYDTCAGNPAPTHTGTRRGWLVHHIGRNTGRPGEGVTEPASPHTLIRYVEDGRATAWLDGTAHTLEQGDALIVVPGASCRLFHDAQHPLQLVTIACSGPLIDQLVAGHGLLDRPHIAQAAIGQMIRVLLGLELQNESAQRRAGLVLHELLAHLGELANQQPDWPEVVRRSKAFIDDNLTLPLRMSDIARHARCSEAHLSRMFRRCLGVPPCDYSLRQRMDLAKRLLAGSGDAIKCIAQQLGYRDAFAFSHAFKNVVGTAPALWRAAERRARELARAS